jgi:hypothetical protein
MRVLAAPWLMSGMFYKETFAPEKLIGFLSKSKRLPK